MTMRIITKNKLFWLFFPLVCLALFFSWLVPFDRAPSPANTYVTVPTSQAADDEDFDIASLEKAFLEEERWFRFFRILSFDERNRRQWQWFSDNAADVFGPFIRLRGDVNFALRTLKNASDPNLLESARQEVKEKLPMLHAARLRFTMKFLEGMAGIDPNDPDNANLVQLYSPEAK